MLNVGGFSFVDELFKELLYSGIILENKLKFNWFVYNLHYVYDEQPLRVFGFPL